MSQNSQNIEDILKQLKDKINDDSSAASDEAYESDNEIDDSVISPEDLQSRLKYQFMNSNSSSNSSEYGEEDSYKLDDDFLSEARTFADDVDFYPAEDVAEAEVENIVKAVEEISEAEEVAEVEEISEVEETPETEEISVVEEIADTEEIAEIEEIAIEETAAEEITEDEIIEDEIIEDEAAEEDRDDSSVDEQEEKTSELQLQKAQYEYYETVSDEDLDLILGDSHEGEVAFWRKEAEIYGDIDLLGRVINKEDEEADDEEEPQAEYDEPNEREEYGEDIFDLLEETDIATNDGGNVNVEDKKTLISLLKENDISPAESIGESAVAEPIVDEEEISLPQREVEFEPAMDGDADFLGEYFDDLLINTADDENAAAKEELSETAENDSQSLLDEEEEQEQEESISEEEAENRLLLQLGYDVYDSINKPSAFDDVRRENIKKNYLKKRRSLLWTLLGSIAITVVLFLYEFLPLIGVQFKGIINAEDYPVSYSLIGLQLLVVCGALSYKKLWNGLKSFASVSPNHNSVMVIALAFTAIYDVIIAISQFKSVPLMFNFLAALTITLSLCVDIIALVCEMRSFSVYFSDDVQYTSMIDKRPSSVAEKMYRGGLSSSQNVYVAAQFTPTNAFFRSLDSQGISRKVFYKISIPCIIASLFAWVLGIVFEADLVDAVAGAMTVMFAILPVSVIVTDVVPMLVMNIKLCRRDIAVTGVDAAKRFSRCNVMVFKDIHFFEKCTPQNTGMVFYDNNSTPIVFKCLNAIYSELETPLSPVFSGISKEGDKPLRVKFTRLVSNGIEAVVGKHSVLVGTYPFMERYGLSFPKGEDEQGAEPLCVSLDGKVTAKISVKYKVMGLFEMLVERLASEGVYCAIETYDPLINTRLVGEARVLGNNAVSVIHLNVNDYTREKYDSRTENAALLLGEPVGISAKRSRLKLAEALIWCCRVVKIRKACGVLACIGSILGGLLAFGVVFMENDLEITQFSILGFQFLQGLVAVLIAFFLLPKSKIFDFEAFREEMLAQAEKDGIKRAKAAQKAAAAKAKQSERAKTKENNTASKKTKKNKEK